MVRVSLASSVFVVSELTSPQMSEMTWSQNVEGMVLNAKARLKASLKHYLLEAEGRGWGRLLSASSLTSFPKCGWCWRWDDTLAGPKA